MSVTERPALFAHSLYNPLMSAPQLQYADGADLEIRSIEDSPLLRIFWRDRLCIPAGGVRRAFPLSQPDSVFSIHDREGNEVCIFETLSDLDEESKRVVVQHLDRLYFTPRIEKVEDLKQDGGMWLFNVSTSRGRTDFYVRNWRDSSFELKPGRWMILSVDGKRFEIPDLEKLDVRSRQLVEQLF